MAETTQFGFTYKEVVEALLKKQGIHEGVWSLSVKFGLQATNIGSNEADLKPAVVIPILEIGLARQEKENNLSVDAARVNPKPIVVKSRGKQVQ